MSRENVEAVRHWIEAYNRRDIQDMIRLSAPDIEFRSVFAGLESGGVFRGYAGIAEYFKAIDDAYDHFQLVPREFLDAGAAVVVVAAADWCGKASSAATTTPIFPAVWLRAGRLFRVETFADRAGALEAVGLRA